MADLVTKPYRPSNGDEGEWFMSQWCVRCTRDAAHRRNPDAGKGCKIIVYMLAFNIGDTEYPRQIVRTAGIPYDQWNPRCTAFREVGTTGASRKPGKQRPVEKLPLFRSCENG